MKGDSPQMARMRKLIESVPWCGPQPKPRAYSQPGFLDQGKFTKLDARVENIGKNTVTFWVGGWRIQIKREDLTKWIRS